MSTKCEPSYESYPFLDGISHYHSWKQQGFNLFRIAIAWQHAQVELGGALNETNMVAVDKLVTAITGDGGKVILDIVSIFNCDLYMFAWLNFALAYISVA